MLGRALICFLRMNTAMLRVPVATFAILALISHTIVRMRMARLLSVTLQTRQHLFQDPKSNLASLLPTLVQPFRHKIYKELHDQCYLDDSVLNEVMHTNSSKYYSLSDGSESKVRAHII